MGKQDRYQQKLNWFKQRERPEMILLAVNDSLLTRIALAWTNTPVRRLKRLTPLQTESESDVWEWLWHNTRFSRDELLHRIPPTDRKIERTLDSLIANRLLYPDGTIHSYLLGHLRNTVLSLFQKTYGRTSKKRN